MKYVYEFIGTFFLVFYSGYDRAQPAIGSSLAVMVYAGAHISGGHYNPAVSLAVWIRGLLSTKDLGLYWVSQLIAGTVAAYLAVFYRGYSPEGIANWGTLEALIGEFLFTFALCYVVLNTATANATKGNSYFGFAIGFTVLVGAYAVGSISGGAFNPAVALGITLMDLSDWSNLWVFIVANLLGGACAALVFKAAHEEEISV